MAYTVDGYNLGDSIEYEYKYLGAYGGKGERRGKRQKKTPEQMERQNQRTREKRMRRLIHLNFHKDDLWMTLKYPKGSRVTIERVKKDLCGRGKGFLDMMRKKYRSLREKFKFIYRMEIGHLGGVHVHVLFNRLEGKDSALMAKEVWKEITGGNSNFEHLYESGGFDALAAYIVKRPESDDGQLTMFGVEEKKAFTRFSSSRNLIRPEEIRVRRSYSHWTMKRLLYDGPKPHPGYYIVKDSVRSGINPFSGYSYFYYTERKLRPEEGRRKDIEAYRHLCALGCKGSA